MQQKKKFAPLIKIGGVAMTIAALGGCVSPPIQRLRPSLSLPVDTAAPSESPDQPENLNRTLGERPTPRIQDQSSTRIAGDSVENSPRLRGDAVRVNVQEMAVPAFINEVFGNVLGLTVVLDDSVTSLQELVTLNVGRRVAPDELYSTAIGILTDYGVTANFDGSVVRFAVAQSGTSTVPPLVVSGRALPSVPISHRPIFQLVELEVVKAADAQRWLSTVFGAELQVRDEAARNSLLISGKPLQVRQALDALRVFDRPMMRGRTSTRLEPAVLSADQLADRLVEVMTLQGYGISKSVSSPSSVVVLPIPAVNALLVFATSQQTLEYTVSWARELDKVSPNASGNSMFYYQVKNTRAADIAGVLNGGVSEGISGGAGQPTAPGAAPAPGVANRGTRIVVDEPRNALIFQGDAAEWGTTLGLIRQMDRAPRQVMVEVTIAEVTLDDSTSSGVQWFAKNGFGRYNGSIYSGGTSQGDGGDDDGSSGGGGSGLTYLLDVAGQNRLTLSALASDSRVSVLSTPRLLVRSGSEASIDIGTEVPTITSQSTSNQTTNGNSNLLQTIQYRKTGIILNIKPTVYSDDRIDLEIEQEVSEALPLAAGAPGGSPSIFNRGLTTSLTLRDGGSVVMAGLISSRQTVSDSGIPFLKDAPVLGRLFGSREDGKNRTELVLMIVPYIIETDDRATQVSAAILDSFDLLEPAASSSATPAEPMQ